GGLNAGEPARVGAHGSTWTQTAFRLGDVDITDPGGTGKPLLLPGVAEWDRVAVSTGIMPPDINAPGMAVTLTPRRPFDTWAGSLAVFASPSFLNAGAPSDTPPPIARMDTWTNGNLWAAGPATDKIGAFVSGTWTRSAYFERANTTSYDSNVGSAFVNLLAA